MGKVHGSLARAGKVRGQTPKVAKATDKPKKKAGRAKKRIIYNRRFVNVVVGLGKKKGPNSSTPPRATVPIMGRSPSAAPLAARPTRLMLTHVASRISPFSPRRHEVSPSAQPVNGLGGELECRRGSALRRRERSRLESLTAVDHHLSTWLMGKWYPWLVRFETSRGPRYSRFGGTASRRLVGARGRQACVGGAHVDARAFKRGWHTTLYSTLGHLYARCQTAARLFSSCHRWWPLK
jgi:small subunit ribosomal protein S30e